MNEVRPIICCDMDGVLVDFWEGTRKILGKYWNEFETREERDARDQMTFGSEGFWESLPELPNARNLWHVLNEYGPVHILTAYPFRAEDPKNPNGDFFKKNAEIGKRNWLTKHGFSVNYFTYHCVLRQNKKLYAALVLEDVVFPNILIDDSMPNIVEWKKAGGIGIRYEDEDLSAEGVGVQLRRYFNGKRPDRELEQR